MAIEFPCGQCGTLLRVPDEAAGKHAKCAKCGAIMLTPPSSVSPQSPPQSLSPQLPSSAAGTPPTPGPSLSPGPGLSPTPGSSSGSAPDSNPGPGTGSGGATPSGSNVGGGTSGGRNPFDLLKPGGAGASSGSPPSVPMGAPSSSTGLGGGQANPFAGDVGGNPYQAPNTNPFSDASPAGQRYTGQPPRDVARGKLLPVGIAMMITGVVSLLFHGLAIVGAVDEMGRGQMNDDEALGLVMIGFWTLWSLVLIASSVGMMRMKSLPLCWAGTVAALAPCTCCLFVSMPIGIWAAIVLADPVVSEVVSSGG